MGSINRVPARVTWARAWRRGRGACRQIRRPLVDASATAVKPIAGPANRLAADGSCDATSVPAAPTQLDGPPALERATGLAAWDEPQVWPGRNVMRGPRRVMCAAASSLAPPGQSPSPPDAGWMEPWKCLGWTLAAPSTATQGTSALPSSGVWHLVPCACPPPKPPLAPAPPLPLTPILFNHPATPRDTAPTASLRNNHHHHTMDNKLHQASANHGPHPTFAGNLLDPKTADAAYAKTFGPAPSETLIGPAYDEARLERTHFDIPAVPVAPVAPAQGTCPPAAAASQRHPSPQP